MAFDREEDRPRRDEPATRPCRTGAPGMQDQSSRQQENQHRHRHPPHRTGPVAPMGVAQPGFKAHQAANDAPSNREGVVHGPQACGVGIHFAQDESVGASRIFVQGTGVCSVFAPAVVRCCVAASTSDECAPFWCACIVLQCLGGRRRRVSA